jgi:hypothetical protein
MKYLVEIYTFLYKDGSAKYGYIIEIGEVGL